MFTSLWLQYQRMECHYSTLIYIYTKLKIMSIVTNEDIYTRELRARVHIEELISTVEHLLLQIHVH